MPHIFADKRRLLLIYNFDPLDKDYNFLPTDGTVEIAISPEGIPLTINSGEISEGIDLSGYSKIAIIYEGTSSTEVTYLNLTGSQIATGSIIIEADPLASSGFALKITGPTTLTFGTRVSFVPSILRRVVFKVRKHADNIASDYIYAGVQAYGDDVEIDTDGTIGTGYVSTVLDTTQKVNITSTDYSEDLSSAAYGTAIGFFKELASGHAGYVEPAHSPDIPSPLPDETTEIALTIETVGSATAVFYVDIIALEIVESSIKAIPDGQTAFDISQDSKVTPGEKVNAKLLWDAIVVEGTLTTGTLTAQAIAFGITAELTGAGAFNDKYAALNLYLNTTLVVFAIPMTTTTDIDRDDWNTAWNDYYNARTVLINAIESANKARLDTRSYVAVKLNQDDFSGDIPSSGDFYVHGLTVDLLEQDVNGRMMQTVDGTSSILSVVKQTKTGILNKRSYLVYSNTEAVDTDTIVPSFYDFNQNGYFTIETASEVCGTGSTTTNIVLGASASAVNDYYNNMVLKITYDADGSTVYRTITDYTEVDATAIVSAVDTAPVIADTYEIFDPVTTGVIIGWVDNLAGDLTDGLIYDRATSIAEGKTAQLTNTMSYLAEATDGATFLTRATFLGIEDAFINLAAYNAFITNLFTQNITLTSGGYIQSDGFATGTDGFKIEHDGTAEFNDITARGTIQAGSLIPFTNISNGLGQAGDNTNFTDFTYDTTAGNFPTGSYGGFKVNGDARVLLTSDDYIAVDTTKLYTMSMWLKTVVSGATPNHYIGFICYDADKTRIYSTAGSSYNYIASGDIGGAGTWYIETIGGGEDSAEALKFNAGTKFIRILVWFNYDADATQSLWASGMSLKEATPFGESATAGVAFETASQSVQILDDGTIKAVDGEFTGTITAGAGSAIDYDNVTDAPSGSGVNIIPAKFSFWNGVDYDFTTYDGTASINASSAFAYFKDNSLKLTATAANARTSLGTGSDDYNIPFTPNKRWIVSLYVSGSIASMDGQLHLRASSGTYHSLSFTTSGTIGEWTRVSGAFDLSADASNMFILRLDNDHGSGDMYYDGIMLEEQISDTATPSAYNCPNTEYAVAPGEGADDTATFIKSGVAFETANGKFKVLVDGSIEAVNGTFSGELIATEGVFGNITTEFLYKDATGTTYTTANDFEDVITFLYGYTDSLMAGSFTGTYGGKTYRAYERMEKGTVRTPNHNYTYYFYATDGTTLTQQLHDSLASDLNITAVLNVTTVDSDMVVMGELTVATIYMPINQSLYFTTAYGTTLLKEASALFYPTTTYVNTELLQSSCKGTVKFEVRLVAVSTNKTSVYVQILVDGVQVHEFSFGGLTVGSAETQSVNLAVNQNEIISVGYKAGNLNGGYTVNTISIYTNDSVVGATARALAMVDM